MARQKSRGFAIIELLIIVAVLAVIGLIVYMVVFKDKEPDHKESTQPTQSQAAADCPDQPELKTPIDLNLVTGILYPGQYRGNEYKAHGGFRFDDSQYADISVKAPLDAKLERASRYVQSGDVQILLEFTGSCGIAYRFDHVLTVSSKLQPVIDALPQPTSDSRTERVEPPVEVKAGDVIATAVGSPSTNNVFVDFGVYDTRRKNKASDDPTWAQEHSKEPTSLYIWLMVNLAAYLFRGF